MWSNWQGFQNWSLSDEKTTIIDRERGMGSFQVKNNQGLWGILCNHYNQIFMRNKKKFSNTPFITFLDGAKEGLVKEKNNRTSQITNRKCDGSHCIKCEIFTTENQHRHWKLVYNCRSIKSICLIFLPDGLLKTTLYVCPYTLYMDNIILFIISS